HRSVSGKRRDRLRAHAKRGRRAGSGEATRRKQLPFLPTRNECARVEPARTRDKSAARGRSKGIHNLLSADYELDVRTNRRVRSPGSLAASATGIAGTGRFH